MPELTRIPNVELIRTGRWPLSSGTWDASAEDLVSAVAALNCPSIRRPVLKLGHVDPRFDGEPSIGYVDNLRITDGGHTLVGDYAGVPSWLGTIAASAYPDRSIEGTYSFRCQQGHSHPFVLTAVALLGVTPPGVGSLKSLQDVAALYGVDRSMVSASHGAKVVAKVSDQPVEAAKGEGNAARLKWYWTRGEGGIKKIRWGTDGDFDRCVRAMREDAPTLEDPKGYCATLHKIATGKWPNEGNRRRAAASTETEEGAVPSPEPSREDLIRSAFNNSQPHSRWIVEIAEDHVVVMDDTDRSLRRIGIEADGEGVSFARESTPVRMAYVPADSELVTASVVFASRAESRPEVAAAEATVLDSQPPNPILPAEPATPAAPPDDPPPTEEPPTPPDEGGVSVPGEEPPSMSGAEPEHTEPKEDPVSLSEMRSRLGLADDADEAAILTAIDALKSKADAPPQPTPEQVAASAAAVKENDELRKEVKVLASRMEQVTAELAAAKAKEAATVKASVLDDAQKQGKFTPVEREQWSKDYDDAPGPVTRILASIAPGTAVPVQAAGYTGTGEEATESFDDTEYARLFGEKAGA